MFQTQTPQPRYAPVKTKQYTSISGNQFSQISAECSISPNAASQLPLRSQIDDLLLEGAAHE